MCSPEKVDMSDRLVHEEGAAGLRHALAVGRVGGGLLLTEGQQRVPGGAEAGAEQLPVGLRELGDLVRQGEEGLAVLAQDAVPGSRDPFRQLAQADAGGQAELDGDGVDLDGPAQLGALDLRQDHLDLTGREGQPAGTAGSQQQLLLLELEHQQLEQLALSPQDARHFGQGHDLASLHARPSGCDVFIGGADA